MYTSNNTFYSNLNNPAPVMPAVGYQYQNYGHYYDYGMMRPTMGYGRNFILIVVLFILLIIVGATIQ